MGLRGSVPEGPHRGTSISIDPSALSHSVLIFTKGVEEYYKTRKHSTCQHSVIAIILY